MNSETSSALSNNSLRRMHAWARETYPNDWIDRCAVAVEYLAQLSGEQAANLIKAGWPALFAAAERDWPEAFEGWSSLAPEPGEEQPV
jgi:hypothetical protein